jgi:hypothetical protein
MFVPDRRAEAESLSMVLAWVSVSEGLICLLRVPRRPWRAVIGRGVSVS